LNNNKCYVGQAKNGLERRWKTHIDAALRGSDLRFHQALRKHGIECWESVILEQVETIDEANISETKWINFYDSTNREKGYNSDKFGRNHDRKWMDDDHKQKLLLLL
jgi:group I intron endonuclease